MTGEILEKQKHLEEEKHTISLHGNIQPFFVCDPLIFAS